MKIFKFLNIAKDEQGIDVYLNGEIINNDLNELYEYFGIEGSCPNKFEEELKNANGKPLTIHINSIGGDLFAGMAMYSAIKNYKGRTTAIVDSVCASAATLPMVACKRIIMQVPSVMMIHEASMLTGGSKTTLKKDISTLESLDNSIANAYEVRTGLSRDKLLEMMKAETWLDSKKAKELGFIDEINKGVDVPDSVIRNIIDNNKKLVACLRGFEQPESKVPDKENTLENGSKIYNGKFSSVQELEKAYANLESEYTKKCQKLAEVKPAKNVETSTKDTGADETEDETRIRFEFAKVKNILQKGKKETC